MSPRGVKWLKAGGILAISLTAATALGLGLAALFPSQQCEFPVQLQIQETEDGLRADVTFVDGTYGVNEVDFRILQRDGESFQVVREGGLSSVLEVVDGVVYYQTDPAAVVLMPGDYITVQGLEATDVMLLTSAGTPLGWTAGCEA